MNKIHAVLALLVVLVPLWGPDSDPRATASPLAQSPSYTVVGTISSNLDESTSCTAGVSGCSASREQSSFSATTRADGTTTYTYSDVLTYTIFSSHDGCTGTHTSTRQAGGTASHPLVATFNVSFAPSAASSGSWTISAGNPVPPEWQNNGTDREQGQWNNGCDQNTDTTTPFSWSPTLSNLPGDTSATQLSGSRTNTPGGLVQGSSTDNWNVTFQPPSATSTPGPTNTPGPSPTTGASPTRTSVATPTATPAACPIEAPPPGTSSASTLSAGHIPNSAAFFGCTSKRMSPGLRRLLQDAQALAYVGSWGLWLGAVGCLIPAGCTVTLPLAGLGLVGFGVANGIRLLAKDPPDPNYTTIAPPVTPSVSSLLLTPQGQITPQVAAAANAYLANQAQSLGLLRAIYTAFNRADGAELAGDPIWEMRQLQAAEQYAAQLATAQAATPGLLATLAAALQAAGIQYPIHASDVQNAQAQLRNGSIPAASFAGPLTQLGVDSAGQADILASMLSDDPNAIVTPSGGQFPQLLTDPSVTAGFQQVVSGFSQFAVSALPTPPPCPSRPAVGIAVSPSGAGRLQVVVTAPPGPSLPTNAVLSLRFGAASGALIDVPGGPTGSIGNFTLPLGPANAQTTFFVRQASAGQAATVPLTVTDGCGDWQTFVGGGPAAFGGGSGPNGAAPTATATPGGSGPAPQAAAAATATRTPTATSTPTPAAICTPRPTLSVTTSPAGSGRLQVTVSAPAAAHDWLRSLRLGSVTNATIDAGTQTGPGSNATVALPAGTQQTTFTVVRTTAGQASTVNLVVVDSCGEWPTVLGGGPSAF